MLADEIHSELEAIEQAAALRAEQNFDSRAEAIDYIEFNVIDRIEGLLQTLDPSEELVALKQDAQRVKRQLEAIDAALFQHLRADIRNGNCTGAALKALIDTHVGRDSSASPPQAAPGYDSLDLFVNGLLLTQPAPTETTAREPEMVFYQKTPAKVIFELVVQAQLSHQDIFYDLGSGLGHVPILVHLLSGVAARGIEVEPAYCAYARACAADLNLPRVTFIQADARTAELSAGTVFFMYTPFEGEMLHAVLERLRGEARHRMIRLFTYGPCTAQVARQRWLTRVDHHGPHSDRLAMFRSL